MISQTGRNPVIAAPTPQPIIAFSEIGVSRTRSSPNFSARPFVTLNAPCHLGPISSPIEICHEYKENNVYVISAKAIDIFGDESGWSEYLITIPRHRSRIAFHPLILQLFERFPILRQLFRIYQI